MTDTHEQFLNAFPAWLRDLGENAVGLSKVLSDESAPEGARRWIGAGLNYVFKSLDLIPDGIDDIGYLDDAFVLRVAADLAKREGQGSSAESSPDVARLSEDAALVREFLGDDYGRLESYVGGLRRGAARGRSVDDILRDGNVRDEFLSDVRGFANGYRAPTFDGGEKSLIKLKAFFDAKLPKVL